ncbi:type II toxin-antitoxin system RelE/ParE family toxin [Pseudoxanthomonas winnipegensis]|uniref:Type II toxin-antitoxin system RelE/ParE family toxin n=1 Tax=Pseudoxanthomonas winnipegensis TaxID=2480810 RepID=A0A4Q8L9W0_9GAMM|nr:type II toxin-antitoxin system RelE/ParE family toxin [Pseudoxanthomonas winnipegensis]RZZ81417.1 type II toxin-antitoxin system RelE/ParE family toxin [Pseudoxanthomonas winnipegensis]TAA25412.1 type II toxin-antitoxin system RelE/ParE family toxin [Pseudoxanthomonas winnipegensis]
MATITATEDFTQWLRKLRDAKARAIIVERVQRVARGLLGDVQPVGGQVSELRIHYGPGYRVYFTRRGEEVVVLLCGGDKTSQAKDIKHAQALVAGL